MGLLGLIGFDVPSLFSKTTPRVNRSQESNMSFGGSSTDADGGVDEEQIVRETDLLLDEFADSSVAYLAQGLVDRAEAYDDGPAAALAIAAELRRRQAAGVRFWPAEQHQSEGSGTTSAANHSA